MFALLAGTGQDRSCSSWNPPAHRAAALPTPLSAARMMTRQHQDSELWTVKLICSRFPWVWFSHPMGSWNLLLQVSPEGRNISVISHYPSIYTLKFKWPTSFMYPGYTQIVSQLRDLWHSNLRTNTINFLKTLNQTATQQTLNADYSGSWWNICLTAAIQETTETLLPLTLSALLQAPQIFWSSIHYVRVARQRLLGNSLQVADNLTAMEILTRLGFLFSREAGLSGLFQPGKEGINTAQH